MNKIEELVTPAVKNLITLCRKFCAYAENLKKEDCAQFYEEMLVMLPGIYRGVMRLPKIDRSYAYEPEKFVSERTYRQIRRQFQDVLGPHDMFPVLADPTMPERMRLAEYSMSEILCDIYQEIKDFVSLYERGTLEEMNDAVRECQTTFKDRLGARLLAAAHMMHICLYQPLPEPSAYDMPQDLGDGLDDEQPEEAPEEPDMLYSEEEINAADLFGTNEEA